MKVPPVELSSASPIVSVIIPMRNEVAHIGACITRLLAQDYPSDRIEIIIVDAMSDDGSRELVQGLALQHPQIRLIDNERRIIPAALNAGIHASSGRYVLRADCRGRVAPNYVRTCVELLIAGAAANVGGPCVSVPGADTAVARSIAAISQHPIVMGGSTYRTEMLAEESSDTVIYGAWERTLFERMGYFNEILERGEDNEFNSRILRSGGRILKTPRMAVEYLCRPTLRTFLQQTYQNGFWHFPTIVANASAFKLRYFAPAAWVCWLAGFAGLAFVDFAFLWPLVAGIGIYSAAVGKVTTDVFRSHGRSVACWVPAVMTSFHLVYGLATIVGIVQFGLLDRSTLMRIRRSRWVTLSGREAECQNPVSAPSGRAERCQEHVSTGVDREKIY